MLRTVPAGLEAYRVDGRVHFRHTENLLDEVLEPVTLRQVHRLESDRLRVRQALGIHVADQDHGGAKNLCRGGCGQANRPGAGDVGRRAHTHARTHGTVEAGR